MARLNTPAKKTAQASRSPLKTTNTPAVTHEGAPAVTYNDKTALFIMATSSFYGEDTFYEKANDRTNRFIGLVRGTAVADPAWFAAFVGWLRQKGNIRTAAIVAAAEGAAAWQKAGITGTRSLVASVLIRADEVGEFLAYWRTHIRRAVPSGVQRALAARINGLDETDTVGLYTERNAIKWDGSNNAYRFADALEVIHPRPRDPRQAALFKYLLDERHHHDGQLTEQLPILSAYKEAQHNLATARDVTLQTYAEDPDLLRRAGMTWENLSSTGPMDAAAWEAIIPNMGYMALLRNLRNFDQAGVSDPVKATVAAKLANPDEVARSRQLPYRFLSAYLAAQGGVWQPALETALQASLTNLPVLDGKTVVLVDTSSSMGSHMSGKSQMSYVQAAALFGVALAAAQGNAELVGFADGPHDRRDARYSRFYHSNTDPFIHNITRGAAVLRTVEAFTRRIGENGHGTEIAASLAWAHQKFPDAARFVVFTDGQSMDSGAARAVPATIPIYAWNLVGYAATAIESGSTRHQLAGLNDSSFRLIEMIEMAQAGRWPWEQPETA